MEPSWSVLGPEPARFGPAPGRHCKALLHTNVCKRFFVLPRRSLRNLEAFLSSTAKNVRPYLFLLWGVLELPEAHTTKRAGWVASTDADVAIGIRIADGQSHWAGPSRRSGII
jgi:hypothetical protein